MKILRWIILIALCTPCFGQSWTGVLSTSRAIDWTGAGLPGTITYGSGGGACNGSLANCTESPANVWTPPVRTQCGATVAAGTSVATINADLAACKPGTYVLLGSGTFTTSSNIALVSGVTLRGSGPQNTKINATGNTLFVYGNCCTSVGGGLLSASPAAGVTSVTIPVTTDTPAVGNLAWFNQCDSGWSGTFSTANQLNVCGTGAYSDNGGLFVCGLGLGSSNPCNTEGANNPTTPPANGQTQVVRITSVVNNGGGSFTVGFTPGLYMPNWSTTNSAAMYWQVASAIGIGMGLENLTITGTNSVDWRALMQSAYASWVSGVRFVGLPSTRMVQIGAYTKNSLVSNNYFFCQNPAAFTGATAFEAMNEFPDSDNLTINNIFTACIAMGASGGDVGDVYAYNYARDVQSDRYQSAEFQHDSARSGSSFFLREGSQAGSSLDDDTWGTHNLNTWFRNYYNCADTPFSIGGVTEVGILADSFSRMENAVGNSIGPSCAAYSGTTSASSPSFGFNFANTDSLTQTTFMRWGNVTSITQASDTPANSGIRFVSSEVPTTLVGNAIPFQNTVPGNNNLPCSFFLAGYTSTTCTPHANGGTGLSWWKVATAWSSFPTGITSSTTAPFPPVGPDVSSGLYVSGSAYDVPAAVAWKNLPIDTAYQNSYTITGSSWSGGTETLTVTGLPGTSTHIMGGFTPPAWNSACNPSVGSASYTGRADNEILMTGSTSTTILYAVTNPGVSCTGTMKFPDVRQFDGTVYQLDSAGAAAPSFIPAAPYSGIPINLTITDPNAGTHVTCYTTDGTTPATNGLGTGCTTGTAYTVPIPIAVTTTVQAISGTSTLTDSAVTSGVYTINAIAPSLPSRAGILLQ